MISTGRQSVSAGIPWWASVSFKAPCQQVCSVRIVMNTLLATSLFVFAILWLNPASTSGRRAKVPKVRCYKVYNADGGSCRKRFAGRHTFKDCCDAMGGAGYQVSRSKRGKRKCVPCSTEENWSAWGQWTKCNSQCGPGISRRTRSCTDTNNKGCPGSRSEKKECVNLERPHCPVHGQWSDWGNWTSCSVSCGEGHQLRFRSCSNPKPQHGGRDCRGAREDQQNCMDKARCPIHGGWSDWGPWSSCPVRCGIGLSRRIRKCDNPKPKYGGMPCNPRKASEARSCDTYKECSGEGYGSASGSGSGDSSGSSGDGSGSGEASGSGAGSEEASGNGKDQDSESEGSGDKNDERSDIKTGSDFGFSEPTTSQVKMADGGRT